MDNTLEYDISIRASSLPNFFDCNERWAAQVIHGLFMPSGSSAAIGTGFHHGTAVWDSDRVINVKPSLSAALDAVAESIEKPTQEVVWNDHTQAAAKDLAVTLVRNYTSDLTLQLDYDVVELPMDPIVVTAANGLRIRFTGQVDRRRMRVMPDGTVRKGIIDFKTGKRIVRSDGTVNTQQSGAQLALYELLELMASGTLGKFNPLPAMVLGVPTAGKAKPAIAEIHRPHRVLVGDKDHVGAIDIIAQTVKTGAFFGNSRSQLCSNKYCPVFANCRWRFQGEPNDDI